MTKLTEKLIAFTASLIVAVAIFQLNYKDACDCKSAEKPVPNLVKPEKRPI